MTNSLGILSNASFEDWTGRQTTEGLRVLRLVSKRPAVVWATQCIKCGTETSVPHSKISYQKCRNGACGKPLRKPSRLEIEREAARERQRVLDETAHRLSELRMADETRDHHMPASNPQTFGNSAPTTERARAEARARREEQEAEERAAREERERPVRELTDKLNETHRKIAAMERDVLTNPAVRDPNFYHDKVCDDMGFLTAEGIAEWNAAEFRNFAQNHKEFGITDRNLEMLNGYFAKHSVLLFTHEMLERFYRRAIACGVEFDKPEPEREETVPVLQSLAKKPEKPKPETYQGFDLITGEPRTYTAKEIDRMTSEQMRRALQLKSRGFLELPNIGPGPRGRN